MTIWEYKIDVGYIVSSKPKPNEMLDVLDERGKQGWELVAFVPSEVTSDKFDWWVYKRPKSVTKDIRIQKV